MLSAAYFALMGKMAFDYYQSSGSLSVPSMPISSEIQCDTYRILI